MNLLKYTLSLLPALLLAACSDGDPIDEGEPIEFAVPAVTVGQPLVDSRAQMLDALPEGEVFGVTAYCVPANPMTTGEGETEISSFELNFAGGSATWEDKRESAIADVMYMQPVKFDGAKCIYRDAADTYYEPARWYTTTTAGGAPTNEFRYTFIAYHPFEGGYFTFPDKNHIGVPVVKFTMPFESSDIKAMLDPTIVRDAMVAREPNRMRANGAVPLTFNHLLSGLRFQINNYNTSDEVTIHSITLSGNFYREASIDYSTDPATLTVDPAATYAGTFNMLPGGEMTVPANSAMIAGKSDMQPQGTVALLLPELDEAKSDNCLGIGKTLTIKYSFQDETQVEASIVDFTIGRRPVQGSLYTVNLSFIGRQLTVAFDSDTELWDVDPDYDGNNFIN